jgi:hypothetical protein
MKRSTILKTFLPLAVIVLIAIIGFKYTQPVSAAYFGAIFTSTFDGQVVNNNLYESKDAVYLNGGPQNENSAGLPDGVYYFQVTNPSGSTLLSSDDAVCRQVYVVGGKFGGVLPRVSDPVPGNLPGTAPYTDRRPDACPAHMNGLLNSANGSTPVQLIPYEDTPNNGGEYKAWLIRRASNTIIDGTDPKVLNFNNSNAKTDNFKVEDQNPCVPGEPDCPFTFTLSGMKFYDADADAIKDATEVGLAGVRILVTIDHPDFPDPVTVVTDADGNWSVPNVPSGADYRVEEILPCVDENNDLVCDSGAYWVQTAPVADSTGFQGYEGTVTGNVSGLDFGDVCLHQATGGLTLGYWSNKNGQKVMTNGGPYGINPTVYPVIAVPPDGTGMGKDLEFLQRLNLKESSTSRRFPDGADYDPPNYDNFRNWLLNGNAVNMSYMLSVQLSATSLDVRHKFLSDSQVVDARNVCNSVGSCLGFISIGEIRVMTNEALYDHGLTLSGDPWRDSLEQMKNFLDDVNNNRLPFVSATPCSVFYPPIQ